MEHFFQTKDLSVGYHGTVLIRDINIHLERGKILTLIGPNGAGKSTILKTISRQLPPVHGAVYIGRESINAWRPEKMARTAAVVLTDRSRPEKMTCAEVVSMGRYPYTGHLGRLTAQDTAAVRDALTQVNALDLADQEFSTLSDGQRQRIVLARAICQEPELIILDEPTAYLDIRHKLELLNILRRMALERGVTVIMSLHEIDLAAKVSDYLLCVKGDSITTHGPPDSVLNSNTVEELYDMHRGAYNRLFGSVELAQPEGPAQVFVVAGGGCGIPCYRSLQKKGIPFATGILFENDVDNQVAQALSKQVVTAPAFEPMSDEHFQRASQLLLQCQAVVDAGTPVSSLNQMNGKLLLLAKESGIPTYRGR